MMFNFYPRSPCGERHMGAVLVCAKENISIHALLAESDAHSKQISCGCIKFLSTLSLRRATPSKTHTTALRSNFYPRSPCGERPWPAGPQEEINIFLSTLSLRRATISGPRTCKGKLFLSTLSLRRATLYVNMPCAFDIISIHALLAESDHPDAGGI